MKGLLSAFDRSGRVAEIRLHGSTLNIGDTFVRAGEFPQQGAIPSRLTGEAVEILKGVAHQSLSYQRCAGQVFDGVVVIEQDRMRELADIVETPFCFGLLCPR